MLHDTHCHMNIIMRNFLDDKKFVPFSDEEKKMLENIMQEAADAGVEKIINVGTNKAQSTACTVIASYFQNCFSAIGIHPNDITSDWKSEIQYFQTLIDQDHNNKIIAIGECGIDKHYPDYNLTLQEEVFHAQIQFALKNNKAIIVHSRDADEETYKVLAAYKGAKNFRGTIHCFASNREYAAKYIDLGFVLGVGGTITYPKNEELRYVANNINIDSIVLETDAPFLSPQKVRGTKNKPANIALIAEFIAQLRNMPQHDFDKNVAANVQRVFGI